MMSQNIAALREMLNKYWLMIIIHFLKLVAFLANVCQDKCVKHNRVIQMTAFST